MIPCLGLGQCPHGFPQGFVLKAIIMDTVKKNGQKITKISPAPGFQDWRILRQ